MNKLIQAIALGLAAQTAAWAVNENIVAGSGEYKGFDIPHPNGNVYDQTQMTGQSITLQADPGQIIRCSFIDINGDIMQCEFSGPGTMKIDLDPATFQGAAAPAKYNQPGNTYVTGKPTITLDNTTSASFLGVFSIGTANAVNQALFPQGQTYDAVADVTLLKINGPAMGAVFMGNSRFTGDSGQTGILAPNTEFAQRVIIHDIDASGTAVPVFRIKESSLLSSDLGAVLIAGGDLKQTNGAKIDVTSQNGVSIANIITRENIRSDGSELIKQTFASDVKFLTGTGTLNLNGQAYVDTGTGETGGDFAATFSDLLASTDSPFKLDGTVGVRWFFSGGNVGTWWVESDIDTAGIKSISKFEGSYTYAISNNNKTFNFVMNYEKLSSVTTVFNQSIVTNIALTGEMPKQIDMTVTQTGQGTGTYSYKYTNQAGAITNQSGNYSPQNPIALATGS